MTHKAKGPAVRQHLPSQVQSNPSKGLKNMDSNSTQSTSTAIQTDFKLADLETPICEIKTFLFMLQVMWEGMPIEKNSRFPNDKLMICSRDRSEAISFSILEAQDKAKALFHMWDQITTQAHRARVTS
jgi:hypothetical protein